VARTGTIQATGWARRQCTGLPGLVENARYVVAVRSSLGGGGAGRDACRNE